MTGKINEHAEIEVDMSQIEYSGAETTQSGFRHLKFDFQICLSFEANFIPGFRLKSMNGHDVGTANMNYELQ